jgi:uncharacterized protein YigA (DUF484 family)
MTDKPKVPAPQPDDTPSLPDAAAVAAYLEAHPDFFVEHEDLLATMRIPHRRGDTVSLVEHQMKILRERNIEMRHRLSHLMDVARDNDRLFDKTRRLILALMDASTLEDVVMILFGDNAMPVGRWVTHADAQTAIGGLLTENKSVSGSLREHELDFLFGEEQRKQIGSTAVVAIAHQGVHGVLAIASRDPQHYKSSVGTLFLSYIAEVTGRVLPRVAGSLRSVR